MMRIIFKDDEDHIFSSRFFQTLHTQKQLVYESNKFLQVIFKQHLLRVFKFILNIFYLALLINMQFIQQNLLNDLKGWI